MALPPQSSYDKKELDKYVRNFVLKTLQIIVQSRMGEKCSYTAKDSSSLDWFSLPIIDIPEVSAMARKTMGSGPPLTQPINAEISLKRKENSAYIYLEVWSLSLDIDNDDFSAKSNSSLYSRMSQGVKAVMSVSRVSPTYRLAQRQKKDDYQIHYQFYSGPPNLGVLREDIKSRVIASVATQAGTIRVTYTYAKKIQMPPEIRTGIPLHPKIDHFSEPRTGQISEPKPCNRKFRNPRSVEDLRILDSQEKQDTFTSTFSTSPPDGTVCSVSPPPLPQIDEGSVTLQDSVDEEKMQQKSPDDSSLDTYRISAFLQGEARPFVALEKPEDRPFASLMAGLPLPSADSSADESVSDASFQEEEGADKKEGEDVSKEESEGSEEVEEFRQSDSPTITSFVMLPPLESPFRDTDPTTDLGQFYHEMQLAPQAPLSMCEDHTVSTEELLADIKGQIDEYSAKQPDFEKFVNSICKDKEEFSD